jgi:hypothetical protein
VLLGKVKINITIVQLFHLFGTDGSLVECLQGLLGHQIKFLCHLVASVQTEAAKIIPHAVVMARPVGVALGQCPAGSSRSEPLGCYVIHARGVIGDSAIP